MREKIKRVRFADIDGKSLVRYLLILYLIVIPFPYFILFYSIFRKILSKSSIFIPSTKVLTLS